MEIGTYQYNPETNMVADLLHVMDWFAFNESKDPNLFLVSGTDENRVIMATNGENMALSNVTPEQIVILFATVRGMKEAARE